MLPRNFSWLEKSKLAGSAQPEADSELQAVRREGIGAIVSLTGTPLNPETVKRLGFKYLHTHISGVPGIDQLKDIAQFIKEQNSSSRPVLVHCAEGMGRTGTVLAAYLVSSGLGSDDAIRLVREKRPGSIQSTEQENAIRDFERATRVR